MGLPYTAGTVTGSSVLFTFTVHEASAIINNAANEKRILYMSKQLRVQSCHGLLSF